jgi:predicted dithiol-disulfide oxidoreductase (DUF899 family)
MFEKTRPYSPSPPHGVRRESPIGRAARRGGRLEFHNRKWSDGSETVGISIFYKDAREQIFHTYSCYERGVDMLNRAEHTELF